MAYFHTRCEKKWEKGERIEMYIRYISVIIKYRKEGAKQHLNYQIQMKAIEY